MAMITQRGVDRFTAGTRQRFAAENEQFDRSQRLKRAARGPMNFDPEGDAAARRVSMERLRQQTQDIQREEQGVRGRYADPAGTEFQGPNRLFDAGDVSLLPDSVLARHGRMAPSELVRTERDRVAGGGKWGARDDFYAGAALGSHRMMDAAVERAANPMAAKMVDENKSDESDFANELRVRRAKRARDFDIATARGQVPGAAVNPGLWIFGSGGAMQRGGQAFEVPMGLGQDRQAVRRAAPAAGGAMLPGMIDPAGAKVIDQRYTSSVLPSRTRATAKPLPSFDIVDPMPKQDLSGVSATELFAQATGAPASPGQPTVSVFKSGAFNHSATPPNQITSICEVSPSGQRRKMGCRGSALATEDAEESS